MNDTTPIIGMLGTGLSYTLGQWNDIVGLAAGLLTCFYMLWKLYNHAKNKNGKYGVAGICNGGGGATAVVFEKL